MIQRNVHLKLKGLLGLVLLLAASSLSGQSQLDSLQLQLEQATEDTTRANLLLEIGKIHRWDNPAKALDYLNSAVELAKETNLPKKHTQALFQIGTVYTLQFAKDSSQYYFERALVLAQEHDFKDEIASIYGNMGILHYYFNNLDSALILYQKSLEMLEETGDIPRQIKRYNNIAAAYSSQTNYPQAISTFFKALRLSEKIGDEEAIVKLYNNIGNSYYSLGDSKNALEYYQKSLSQTSPDQINFRSTILSNLGEIWLSEGKPNMALEQFRKVLEINAYEPNCNYWFGTIGIARTYLELGLSDSALYYSESTLAHMDQCRDPEILTWGLVIAGRANLEKGNLAQAEKQLLQTLSRPFTDKDIFLFAFKDLSTLYERQGRHKESLKYHKLYKNQQDSIFNERNARELARAEMNFELETEKDLLRAEQENNRLRLERQVDRAQSIRNYFIGGSLLLLAIIYILYLSYRRKRSANKVLEEKNRTILNQQEELLAKANQLRESNARVHELSDFKERLAHMAVHDMKNPLNTLIGLSQGEPTPKKMKIIRKSSLQMFNFITNMLDIYKFEQAHITLNLKACQVAQLVDDAVQQVEGLLQEKGIQLIQRVDPNIRGAFDAVIIIRVLVNLLTNAIKYSDVDSEIFLEAKKVHEEDGKDWLHLAIEDKGTGISPDLLTRIFEEFNPKKQQRITKSASTGIGLNFCKLAVKACKGTIQAQSEVNRGTTITVSLPLHQTPIEEIDEDTPQPTQKAEEQLILPNEAIAISSYAHRLKDLKVHEVGKINSILGEMERERLESPWRERIQGIVYAGHQKAYDQLIEKAESL